MKKAAMMLSMALVIASPLAFSSGGYGGGSGSFNPPAARKVDQSYEYGKAIYQGRLKEIGKINFCITSGDKKVKIKGKTIKAYRGASATELANNIFNCDKPDELIFHLLGKDNFTLVLYYFNKRYKLKLT